MKKKRKKMIPTTLLGPDSSVEGILEFHGVMQLDGNVKGKIISNGGTVIIGEKAVINADIIVDGAIIKGEVNGTIDAKESIEIYYPGKVIGDIQAPEISIDTGAIFNGNCGMSSQKNVTEKTITSPKKLPEPDETKKK